MGEMGGRIEITPNSSTFRIRGADLWHVLSAMLVRDRDPRLQEVLHLPLHFLQLFVSARGEEEAQVGPVVAQIWRSSWTLGEEQ